MGIVSEFKDFIAKGNVMDLAVGVIIGGAFGTIVTSLTDDVIMPLVGLFGEADFTDYYLPLQEGIDARTLAAAREQGAVLAYGSFITAVVNFLILAFIIFMMVKAVNRIRAQAEDPANEAPAEPPADVKLLGEIRDLIATNGAPSATGTPGAPGTPIR